jgi:hypothetical protein
VSSWHFGYGVIDKVVQIICLIILVSILFIFYSVTQMVETKEMKEDECYKFEDIVYDEGLFDKSIDATYIIFLEGNEERKSNIKTQLKKIQPSKNIHILINKGFRKCKKDLKEQLPRYDLIDCFMKVFKDSQMKGYNNILVLEDDFHFSEKIIDRPILESINDFIYSCSERNMDFIYLLGCVPYLQCPKDSFFSNNRRVLLSTGCHACIYSKKFIQNILNTDQKDIDDWDLHINFNCIHSSRFMYKEPLCYQLFYETDNYNSWIDSYNFKYIIMCVFKYLNMHKSPEPGFSYFYSFSFYVYYFLILILSIIVISVIKFTRKIFHSSTN